MSHRPLLVNSQVHPSDQLSVLSCQLSSRRGLTALFQAHHPAIGCLIGTRTSKVVERLSRRLNDMTRNERSALSRTLTATLYTAFPFQYGPALKTVLREFGKNTIEIHLSVAQRAEPPSPVNPRLVASVYALPSRRMKFCILGMKHFDVAVIKINELQIVELLKHEMGGFKKHVGT